jgi:hypothetical protein
LRHRAGFRKDSLPNTELTRAISRLTYVDDEVRLQQWAAWLAQGRPPAPDLSNPLMLMMFSALGFVKRPVTEMSQAFDELWSVPDLRREIVELLRLLDDRSRRPTFAFPDLPFRLHASYSRDEISAGLLQTRRKSEKATDRRGPAKLLRTQGGVFQCKDARSDILYVELDKDPKHYTPTTLYDDRAVTPSLFHWESQSVTRAESETGRRYRASASSDWRILLFVRHKPDDARGFTSPYLFLGRVRYVSHESEKPMRIMWKLDAEMPLDFFSEVKIAAG